MHSSYNCPSKDVTASWLASNPESAGEQQNFIKYCPSYPPTGQIDSTHKKRLAEPIKPSRLHCQPKLQRGEPTVGSEERRGALQRTPTQNTNGGTWQGSDQPAMQRADPPDIAAHEGSEALTADKPDTDPEGPTPDTECEEGLHPPSATDRAGAATLANLALRAKASTLGRAPPRDPSETQAGSETREAPPDRPQRAAHR